MKINFLGNTCNNHYSLAKFLRRLGVDAHVYYNVALDPQTFPQSEDPHIDPSQVPWLHPYSNADIGSKPWVEIPERFAREISNCDLIQAEDVGLLWAHWSGKPYVWHPYGYDLDFYPFLSYWANQWSVPNPDCVLAPYRYREAIRNTSGIALALWYQLLSHGMRLLQMLCPDDHLFHGGGLAIDTDRFSPGSARSVEELLRSVGISGPVRGTVYFYPARVMFTEASYVNKGTDLFLNALARFRRDGGECTLIITEKGSQDEAAAREIIRSTGLDTCTYWIPKQTRAALVEWYRAVDVVVDELVYGCMGSISLESLSCGTAHMIYIKTDPGPDDGTFWSPRETYASLPPVLTANTVEGISQLMSEVGAYPALLKEIGAQSREWALKYPKGENVAAQFKSYYQKILAKPKRTPEISEEVFSAQERYWEKVRPTIEEKIHSGDISTLIDDLITCADTTPFDERYLSLLLSALEDGGWNYVPKVGPREQKRFMTQMRLMVDYRE